MTVHYSAGHDAESRETDAPSSDEDDGTTGPEDEPSDSDWDAASDTSGAADAASDDAAEQEAVYEQDLGRTNILKCVSLFLRVFFSHLLSTGALRALHRPSQLLR